MSLDEHMVDERGDAVTPMDTATGEDVQVDAGAEAGGVDKEPGDAAPRTPRTRWAAIVWGLFFGSLAYAGIWMLSDADRRAGLVDWVMALTPGTIVAVMLLGAGVLVLVAGVAGLIRHAQRRLTR